MQHLCVIFLDSKDKQWICSALEMDHALDMDHAAYLHKIHKLGSIPMLITDLNVYVSPLAIDAHKCLQVQFPFCFVPCHISAHIAPKFLNNNTQQWPRLTLSWKQPKGTYFHILSHSRILVCSTLRSWWLKLKGNLTFDHLHPLEESIDPAGNSRHYTEFASLIAWLLSIVPLGMLFLTSQLNPPL